MKESGCHLPNRKIDSTRRASFSVIKVKEDTHPLVVSEQWNQALNLAVLSV
jgi:hypothetical protein